jgi:hypothetical protein
MDNSNKLIMGYKMVHNNILVTYLSDKENKIYTNNTIFLGDTLNDCFNEIDKLKLNATYITGDTQVIIFSGGTRTIKDINDI